MAEICCGVVSESETSTACKPRSREARRKRMEIRRFNVVEGVAPNDESHSDEKRQKLLQLGSTSFSRECQNAVENCATDIEKGLVFVTADNGRSEKVVKQISGLPFNHSLPVDSLACEYPKFGVSSVCGRRRDMEDAVAVHPWFCRDNLTTGELHYFGVYDGHGCSHV